MTFPYAQGQIPIYYNRRNSARRHQGFYKDMTSQPLYPFGYGLSYTHFSYGEPKADKLQVAKNGMLTVTIPVSNDGDYDGKETVFWYVSDPYCKLTRPNKELKFFEKKLIKKGETAVFTFDIDVERDFGFIDAEGHRFVEEGEIYLVVGDKQLTINVK